MVDIVIVGAGIIGTFLAHDLSMYEGSIVVLEKNVDVANEITMANSAIIHSGHDPKEGTLKAKLNVRGNEMYENITKSLGVSFKRVSAFVVATSEVEEKKLDFLYEQARNRNVPVYKVSLPEAKEKEKNLSERITKVIELPSTGIILPWEVSIALMEEAILNGVKLQLNTKVEAIERIEDEQGFYYCIHTNHGDIQAKTVINAAGIYADEVYNMVATGKTFTIHPKKGEYYVLDKSTESLVSRVIYPVPSEKGKGVLVVPTIHGNMLLGPNSDFVEDKEENNNTKEALDYVKRELGKTIANVPMQQVIRTFAGLRPSGDTSDFIIQEAPDAPNFINVACIESPGLASAPAIAEFVIENIYSKNHILIKKEKTSRRKPYTDLKKMSEEKRDELVKRNPAFANIICRCEQISEGEILEAIHSPLGATTVKGIKKRCRPGMGRCQGGFCEPLVVNLIARELGMSPMDVTLDGEGSSLLIGMTKQDKKSNPVAKGGQNERI